MALNFPLNPISGQTYSINGKDWVFNGFAWDAVNIQSSGPIGPQGVDGPQGKTGPSGTTGVQGNTGFQGFTGPQGATGSSLFYRGDWNTSNEYSPNDYVNYNEVLYINYTTQSPGSNPPDQVVGAWVQLTLYGQTGLQGQTGPQGFTGLQGSTGPQGFTGNQGETGPQGFTGNQGETGPQGFQGYTGPQGYTGSQGITGPQGNSGPQGTTGPKGDDGQSSNRFLFSATFSTTGDPGTGYLLWNSSSQIGATQINISHIDSIGVDIDVLLSVIKTQDTLIIQDRDDSNNYQKFTVNNDITFTFLYTEVPVSYATSSGTGTSNFSNGQQLALFLFSAGVAGPQGFQGNTGPQGLTGLQGVTGVQGLTGPQGNTGSQGFTGLQGNTGPQGVTGVQGFTGPQGPTGVGTQGPIGPAGSGTSPITSTEVSFGTGTGITSSRNFTFTNSSKTLIFGTGSTIGSSSEFSAIIGGRINTIGLTSGCSSIIGGYCNTIESQSCFSSIIGSRCNTMFCSSGSSIISGGRHTMLYSYGSSIIGGGTNTMFCSLSSAIIGGICSCVCTSPISSIIGGCINKLTSSCFSSIIGGSRNCVVGSSYISSIIGGYVNTIATQSRHSSIIGGQGNRLVNCSCNSSILSSRFGEINNSPSSVILGGEGYFSIPDYGKSGGNQIIGGRNNLVTGGYYCVYFGDGYANSCNFPNRIYGSTSSSILGGSGNVLETSINSSIISGQFATVSNSCNSVIIGGVGLTLSNENSIVFVPRLKIATASNVSASRILVWDDDNYVKYREVSTISGGGGGGTGPQGLTGPQGSTGSNLPFYYSTTAPTVSSLTAGSRWFHSETGVEYVYIDDGDSMQWVQPTSTIAGSLNHYTSTITSSSQSLSIYSQYGPEYYGVSSSVTSYLHLPTNVVLGKTLTIKDESGSASIYPINIVPYIGEYIDNSNGVQIDINYGSITILRRNNNWWII